MSATPATDDGAAMPAPLASLGLSDEDQRALARQGFVAAEFRGRGGRRQGPYALAPGRAATGPVSGPGGRPRGAGPGGARRPATAAPVGPGDRRPDGRGPR